MVQVSANHRKMLIVGFFCDLSNTFPLQVTIWTFYNNIICHDDYDDEDEDDVVAN